MTIRNEEVLTYSVDEVAALLGLSRNACYAACKNGILPSIRISKRILIPKAALLRYLETPKELVEK